MNVFICWSGVASQKLAEGLRDWLPRVIQATKPFLSSADISKGERWHAELNSKLEGTNYGVLCMTPENLTAPWILFEAGALSKNTESGRVSALMLGIKQTDLPSPLGQFQHTELNSADVLKLVRGINAAMKPDLQLESGVLDASFRAHWPFLEKVIAESRDVLKDAKKEVPRRATHDMFEEIIGMLRDMNRAQAEIFAVSARSALEANSRMYLGVGPTGPTGPVPVFHEGIRTPYLAANPDSTPEVLLAKLASISSDKK